MTGVRQCHSAFRPLRRALLALALVATAACNGGNFAPDTFDVLASTVGGGAGRAFHAAVSGPDGDVHLVGGQDVSGLPLNDVLFAERYRWSLRLFVAEQAFTSATGRVDPLATLYGGEVLALGGQVSGATAGAGPPEYLPMSSTAAADGERYDVSNQVMGAFALTGGAANAALVRDGSGDLFLIGGRDASNNLLGEIRVWNANTHAFDGTGTNLLTAREGCTATLLSTGEILIVGGWSAGTPLQSAELFDPTLSTITATPAPVWPRAEHTATASADGRKVLLYGGFTAVNTVAGTANADAAAEVYDVTTGTFSAVVTLPAPTPRVYHAAVRMGNGDVLIVGGVTDNAGTVSDTAQIYRFTGSGSLRDSGDTLAFPRFGHTATLLPDGTVLVAGGLSGPGSAVPEAERYFPEVL